MFRNSKVPPIIGVLALQGAFIEHVKMLRELGVEAREVRLPADLEGLDGLIIPGGESTTIGKLMTRWGLIEPIKDMAERGTPVWGTCAGMILLAQDIGGLDQPLIGLMDIKVKRNAFGSQLDSFEADIHIPALEAISINNRGVANPPFRGVFIRAPYIEQVGSQAEELARLETNSGAEIIVAARQQNLLATAFHPELTGDSRFHQLFLGLVEEQRG